MRILVMVLGMALLCGNPSSATEAPEYTLDMLILKVPTTLSRLEADSVAHGGGCLFMQGPFVIRWGAVSLESDGSKVRFGTIDLWERRFDEAQNTRSPIYVMSAPRVTSRLGQGVEVKSSIPGAGPLQYLKEEADGRFSLHHQTRLPEMSLRLTAHKGETAGTFRVDWGFELVRIGERQPVGRLTLEVGEPQILEQSGKATDTVGAGRWNLLLFGEGEKSPGFAILLRIRPGR